MTVSRRAGYVGERMLVLSARLLGLTGGSFVAGPLG
jgi:hypothetical protein